MALMPDGELVGAAHGREVGYQRLQACSRPQGAPTG